MSLFTKVLFSALVFTVMGVCCEKLNMVDRVGNDAYAFSKQKARQTCCACCLLMFAKKWFEWSPRTEHRGREKLSGPCLMVFPGGCFSGTAWEGWERWPRSWTHKRYEPESGFCRDLRRRGVSGVRCVTSDAREGLAPGDSRMLSGRGSAAPHRALGA